MRIRSADLTTWKNTLGIYSDILIILSVLLSLWLMYYIWGFISLPFSNPLEVYGPLVVQQFNPLNNILRYVLLVAAAVAVYALFNYRTLRLPPQTIFRPVGHLYNWNYETVLTAAPVYILCSIFVVILNISDSFSLAPLDVFHEGESLTPAWNYLQSGGIWSKSFFVHGAFYDVFSTILAWNFFQNMTVGAFRAGLAWMNTALVIALLTLVFVIALIQYEKPGQCLLGVTVYSVGILFPVVLFNWRDVPVVVAATLLVMSPFRLGEALLFLVGLIGAWTFMCTIDRGAYLSALLLFCVLPLLLLWREWFRAAALLLGLLVGWAGIVWWLGLHEFKGFVQTTAMLFATKDLFDSYIFGAPFTNRVQLLGLFVSCAAGLLAFDACFNARSTVPERLRWPIILMGVLGIFYFRSALGRSDDGHVYYSLGWPTLALVIYLGSRFTDALARAPGWVSNICSVLLLLALFSSYAPHLSWANVVNYRSRLREYVALPDASFLTPQMRSILDTYADLAKADDCVQAYTSEGAWPFLLKKPGCTRFHIVWFISPRPLRDEFIEEIKEHGPQVMLVNSPLWTTNIDGISNAERFPDVDAFVRGLYPVVREKDGWEFGRRDNPR